LLISIGLLGCGTDPGAQVKTVGCNPGGNCKVAVTVNNCAIKIEPDPLPVPDRGRIKKIDWDIASTDSYEYVFRSNGIAFKKANDEFDQPKLSHNGKSYSWRDKHSVASDYAYAVNVARTGDDPKDCPTLDPVISNQ
jgi:hypothetical protein